MLEVYSRGRVLAAGRVPVGGFGGRDWGVFEAVGGFRQTHKAYGRLLLVGDVGGSIWKQQSEPSKHSRPR